MLIPANCGITDPSSSNLKAIHTSDIKFAQKKDEYKDVNLNAKNMFDQMLLIWHNKISLEL